MTQARLDKLCKIWQERLRLQDWNVTVTLKPKVELSSEAEHLTMIANADNKHAARWAHNEWDNEEMSSKIEIEDNTDDSFVENCLVHELLHLRMDKWDASYGDADQETCINLLADCFVKAYRRKRRKEGTNGTTS